VTFKRDCNLHLSITSLRIIKKQFSKGQIRPPICFKSRQGRQIFNKKRLDCKNAKLANSSVLILSHIWHLKTNFKQPMCQSRHIKYCDFDVKNIHWTLESANFLFDFMFHNKDNFLPLIKKQESNPKPPKDSEYIASVFVLLK